jgi:colanic acid/amylovoran biosynthesis glycosyltransferase
MTSKQRVLIYRDFLLPPSETFIKSQGEGLTRFEPTYVGLTCVEGIQLPPERIVELQKVGGVLGWLERAAFGGLGVSPRAYLKLKLRGASLVHAHFGIDASRIMRLVRALGLPLIATFHDYDITTSDAELLKLAPYCAQYIRRRPALNRQATAFLAVSDFIRQKAIARGFSAEKILVHYIGIDVERFSPEHTARQEPIVLFVGRLVEKKGCEYLIRAMADVESARPDAKLVIIGDGPLRAECEALAAKCLKNYQFLGALSSNEVRAWHRRARVFCLPSVTASSGETEGLPISVLEALAMALPTVSTRHAGIPEAILHGKTGLLADERDAPGLAAQILELLNNPELGHRFGAAGRELVEKRFSLKRQIALLEEVYQQVAEHPTRVPGI